MTVDANWQVVPLGSLCEQIYDGPHATPKKTLSGPIFLGIWNLSNGRLDLSETEHLSEDDFAKWTRRVTPEHGDIVFSYETRLGDAAMIPDGLRCCLGRRMGLLRINRKKAVPRFVLYAYLAPEFKQTIRSRTVQGSTVERILLTELGGFPVRVPPLGQQRAMAEILGALDDKMELNRRMNETLEAIARAIFKSWFVDFDPVRAKLALSEAEGMEGHQPFGTDAAPAALFPDAFEDSPLGKIPKGWAVKPLDEIATFLNGLALQNYPPKGDQSLPVIKIRELRQGVTDSSNRADLPIPREYIIDDGDVLFSWSGSLELVVWCSGRGALNQHLFKVTSGSVPPWFFYHWIAEHLPEFRAIAAGKATTMGHIQRHHLSEALTVVPDAAVMNAADARLSPIWRRFITNRLESRTLAELRDTLLPKLLSGEVRVKDAERFAAKHA